MRQRQGVRSILILLAAAAGLLVGCASQEENRELQLSITAPADNHSARQEERVIFTGSAHYRDGEALPAGRLTWSSNHDGVIGVGSSFQRSGLSVNQHIITLTAEDELGERRTTSVILNTTANGNGAGVVLSAPAAGTVIASHDLVVLQGAGSIDGQVVTDPLLLEWRSDLDGVLGNGPRIEPGGLQPGPHRISLTARRERTGSPVSQAEISLTVQSTNALQIQADILAPAPGTVLGFGQPVTFNGAASQDGSIITGTDLRWTSSMDGLVGIGETCIVPNMSRGTHRVTMQVTGANSLKTAVSILMQVE